MDMVNTTNTQTKKSITKEKVVSTIRTLVSQLNDTFNQ